MDFNLDSALTKRKKSSLSKVRDGKSQNNYGRLRTGLHFYQRHSEVANNFFFLSGIR